jgi:ATP-dependent Clp protease ATP-binding subunit ClpC
MGKTEGSLDMAELLKPKLSDGSLRLIGATTTAEYRKTLEKDAAFSRRFENLVVHEPNKEAMLTILRKIEQSLEKHYGLTIRDSALGATVDLADRYLKERKFPDKAMLLLHQACAKVKSDATTLPLPIFNLAEKIIHLTEKQRSLTEELQFSLSPVERQQIEQQLSEIPERILALQQEYEQQKTDREKSEKKLVVDAEVIAQVISEQTNIPLTKLQSEDSERLLYLEQELAKRVIGQDEAISALSSAIRRARIGLKDPKKPMGSFLFL